MSDMYKWLEIVKQGMQMAMAASEKEARQAEAEFADNTSAKASIYAGQVNQKQHYDFDNTEHAMTGKPDLQAGQTVVIDQLYGPGAGHGVFVAYSLDGNSAICNVDSVEQSIPIEFVSRAPADARKEEFSTTGSEGCMSPLSAGEQNRADLRASVSRESEQHVNKDTPMENLEKWMKIIAEDNGVDELGEEENGEDEEEIEEGYSVRPSIDKERYTDLSGEGLEGPFSTKSGKIVYYDPKAGQYYDRDTDMYISDEDYRALDEAAPVADLDAVWRKVEQVVSQIAPDGDPIDYLGPWLERNKIPYEAVNRAAKRNGYKDVYAYYDEVCDEYHSSMGESAAKTCDCGEYDCEICFPSEKEDMYPELNYDDPHAGKYVGNHDLYDSVEEISDDVAELAESQDVYPEYGPYDIIVNDGDLPGIDAGRYVIMFDADVRVDGKYYPATRFEPEENPEVEVDVTYAELYPADDDISILSSDYGPRIHRALISLIPDKAIYEIENAAMEPKDESELCVEPVIAESKKLKESKMKLKEFGPLVGMAVRAGGAAIGSKIADKVMGENEWEEEPINGFGAADELDDIESSDELGNVGAHDAPEDVSDLIGEIDYLQNLGMSMANREYNVDKLIDMPADMIKRIHSKVKGTIVTEWYEEEDDQPGYYDDEESEEDADGDDSDDGHSDYDPSDDRLDPERHIREADEDELDFDFEPATDDHAGLNTPKGIKHLADEPEDEPEDEGGSLSLDAGDEVDGLDEPEVEVPAARIGGASMDVSDMLGKIAYMQDMGMSLSDRHYDTEKLMMMNPDVIQRVYSKVVGESKKVSSDMFISTLKESKRSKKTKPAINEGADPDVVKALKALFE